MRSANYCNHPSIEERQRREKGKLTCSSTLHSVWSVYSSKGSRLYLRVPLNRTGSCRYTHHISHTLLTATPQHTSHQSHTPHCYTSTHITSVTHSSLLHLNTHHISHTLLTATPQHTSHQSHTPHCYTSTHITSVTHSSLLHLNTHHISHTLLTATPQHCSPDHHKLLRGSNANIQYLGYDGDVATEVM